MIAVPEFECIRLARHGLSSISGGFVLRAQLRAWVAWSGSVRII